MRILLVCTGNTCRSPMAEVLLKDAVRRSPKLKGHVEVRSAGVFCIDGGVASDNAVAAMREWGHDLSSHRSSVLDEEMIDEADLILGLTTGHVHQIQALYPNSKQKVHALLEYAGGEECDGRDVMDPYGGDLWEYRRCAEILGRAAASLVEKLERRL